MCSTVVFHYKCGCSERVVFECPFSSAPSSNLAKGLHADSRQNCSRRYRLHQKKLFPPQKLTVATTTIPSSPKLPILPPPKLYSSKSENTEEREADGETTTEIDEICHDCWQRGLGSTKQRDNDSTSSTTMGDYEDDKENRVNVRVLRERSVNELILPPLSTNPGTVSSIENFSGD
ncbi:hypothetical protein GQX73_g4440 [Xylaria multiplex]|uniref:Uncharacterized protein n=1 Tax=Xylaria multiplex TaxID=323545 RepID=A0A7C8MVP1_9PEZI|nr:hypothetical protein GQX73_g4440 [Xylaria multiplex]